MRFHARASLLGVFALFGCADPVVLAPTDLPVGAVVVTEMKGGLACPSLGLLSQSSYVEEMTVREAGPAGPRAVTIKIVEDKGEVKSPDGLERDVSPAEGVAFESDFEHDTWQRRGSFNGDVWNALNSWESPAALDDDGEYPPGEVRRSFTAKVKTAQLETTSRCTVGERASEGGRPAVKLACEGEGTYYLEGTPVQLTDAKSSVVRDLGYRLTLRDETTASLFLPDATSCTLRATFASRVTTP